jgi:hypothetical protein
MQTGESQKDEKHGEKTVRWDPRRSWNGVAAGSNNTCTHGWIVSALRSVPSESQHLVM